MKFNDEINLGFVYIGTLVGAGFATGQEILEFFTQYGGYGFLGICVSCILFFFFGYRFFSMAISRQSSCIGDILMPYLGRSLLSSFEILVDIFSLGGFSVMIAGCGAVINESLNIPSFSMTVTLCVLCILWLQRGVAGLTEVNRFLVSIMILLTFLIGVKSLPERWSLGHILDFSYGREKWLFSSILYFSYNMILAMVVIAALGTYTKRQNVAFGAAFLGALGLFIMAFLLWMITTVYYSALRDVEVPLMWVAKYHGTGLYFASMGILLSAMLTTALSVGFSFIRSVSRRFGLSHERASYILLLGLPLSQWGFSRLIKTIYPLFGVIGIFFIFLMVFRRFLGFKIE